MSNAILEVIVCSVADAIETQRGGASRLEVVRELDRGGLTPSLEVVHAIKQAVDLPLRVMVRENDGYEIGGAREFEKLCAATREFARLGVDGFVLGFLKTREIDVDLTARVLACAPEVKATFHHAFEDAADQLRAISQLRKMRQVDRILCHGGSGDLNERRERLDSYAHAAAPEITIIAGGGIDVDGISLLTSSSAIREFHVGRAAREGHQVSGRVQVDLVQSLLRATQQK